MLRRRWSGSLGADIHWTVPTSRSSNQSPVNSAAITVQDDPEEFDDPSSGPLLATFEDLRLEAPTVSKSPNPGDDDADIEEDDAAVMSGSSADTWLETYRPPQGGGARIDWDYDVSLLVR